jgi:single-stranded DNA-binding protein
MLEVAFTGAVAKDPELRTSGSGKQWCSTVVAVGKGDGTMWFRVASFGDVAAEFAGKAAKGDTVHVEGTLKIGTYQAKDGAERVSLDVVARYVRVAEIGRRRRPARRRNGPAEKPAASPNDFHNDEIGF